MDLDEEVQRLDNTIPTRVTKSGKRASLNRLKHGPEMPCYSGMSAAERQVSKEVFVKQRKKHIDASRHTMLREAEIHHNESTATIIFTGNLSPTLRTMDQVRRERLCIGLTFPNQEIILLRVAEEANLCLSFIFQWLKVIQQSYSAVVKMVSWFVQITPLLMDGR